MGRIFGLVLTPQPMGDFGGEPTERQVLSIDDKPVVVNVFCLGANAKISKSRSMER